MADSGTPTDTTLSRGVKFAVGLMALGGAVVLALSPVILLAIFGAVTTGVVSKATPGAIAPIIAGVGVLITVFASICGVFAIVEWFETNTDLFGENRI